MTLFDLQEGRSAIIQSIQEGAFSCKLLTLGIRPEVKVTYVRKAPFGGARYLKLEDSYVAIRASEAKTITIQAIK